MSESPTAFRAYIPFDQIAFSSVATSLTLYLQDRVEGHFPMHHGVIDKIPGSSFNDSTTFRVRSHLSVPLSRM
ncbi:hypothetical protein FOA52_002336 [Chlamydomonas sp. UWO 241]|nr:hypothetical protein FOA52_002336 [Chlamydomonas sp. UWO 241]